MKIYTNIYNLKKEDGKELKFKPLCFFIKGYLKSVYPFQKPLRQAEGTGTYLCQHFKRELF